VHYLQFLVLWRRLGDTKAARDWLTRVRLLAYRSTAPCETTQSEGAVHRIENPSTEDDLDHMADIQHSSSSSTGWTSPQSVTPQAELLEIDPRRERWEPKEWEVDSYGWIRRRKDEDVGMYSVASEWMGGWKIRRLGFEDRTPELLKSQEPPRSTDPKPPFEKLDKGP